MAKPTLNLKNRYLAAFLAWLVPGLGHFYQGRIGKGFLYSITILSLFFVGLALGDWRIVYWRWIGPIANTEQFCFSYLCQFFAGLPALPALIQATLKWYGHDPILAGFMAEPTQNEINALYPRLGKLVEIGNLYTMIAGLLNILVIYDALEGPAHDDEAEANRVVVLPKTEMIGTPLMNPLSWSLLPFFAQVEPVAVPFARSIHVYWFLLPLVIAISLVYSATRHEAWAKIGSQSLRLCGAIVGILLVTTIVLLFINTQV